MYTVNYSHPGKVGILAIVQALLVVMKGEVKGNIGGNGKKNKAL